MVYICYCNKVKEADIMKAITEKGAKNVDDVIKITGAMQNSNCAVNNPKGICCYSDIVKTFNKYREKIIMKKMKIFEPAMCCPTGLCGLGVDPELLRLSTVLVTLKKHGVIVERFNLGSAPAEFITDQTINAYINEKGTEGLPAVMLDGKIVITGRYPTNEEFTKLLDLPENVLGKQKKSESGGGCCKGGCC